MLMQTHIKLYERMETADGNLFFSLSITNASQKNDWHCESGKCTTPSIKMLAKYVNQCSFTFDAIKFNFSCKRKSVFYATNLITMFYVSMVNLWTHFFFSFSLLFAYIFVDGCFIFNSTRKNQPQILCNSILQSQL